jgi:hypothetical protein
VGGSKKNETLRAITGTSLIRGAWEAPAKCPGKPRAYLFGARAAPAVRPLLGPALAEARILSATCLECPSNGYPVGTTSRGPTGARSLVGQLDYELGGSKAVK